MDNKVIDNYMKCPRCRKNLILADEGVCVECKKQLTQQGLEFELYYIEGIGTNFKTKTYSYMDNPVDVFVCQSTRSTCLNKRHNVELRNLYMPYQRKDGDMGLYQAHIVADYCYDCQQYQVNADRMRLYRRDWGSPIVFSRQKANNNIFSAITWEEKSDLANWGYTASNKVTAKWRQARLSYLIDNGQTTGITKEGVVRHLDKINSMARDMPTLTNQDAIPRRIEDIIYVQNKYVQNKPISGELNN